ncbi:dynamin family protein [Alkalihalobacterium sp. APHAB7]|uniref:dynamin family protein n=1 Tax=Alkalihalobacterium sp. APHAB7 TaxID=3402081 RepID=UPI003AAFD7D1
MSFSLEGYKRERNKLIDKLDHYSIVLKDMENDLEYKKILGLKEQILQDQFQVVVVGEFSRGKSTFINALLGKRILPSSAKPTTATLNVITYSEDPFIHLHFHNEKKQPMNVSEETFKKLVAPKDPLQGDEESEKEYEQQMQILKSIKYAELGHPLSFCSSGVTIIDTPGTNDLDPAREQVTNNIIPKSDAAILILSAIKILSESEISFLRDRLLANDIQKIFIVINFKDELENEQAKQKVLDYAYEHLKDILHEPKIFLVAAKEALNARRKEQGEEMMTRRGRPVPVWDLNETGFIELEESLAQFLQYERGTVKLKKPIKRIEKSIETVVEKQIHLEKRALSNQMDDLQEKVEAFRPKLNHVKQIGTEALKKISFELQKNEDPLVRWYSTELDTISREALTIFENNRYLGVNEITRLVENGIAPLERDLHLKKKEKITTTVKACIDRMSQTLNEEWIQLEDDLQTIYQPDMDGKVVRSKRESEQNSDPTIFDEIYNELDVAWDQSNSFFGKAAIVTGFIATGIVHGVTSIFKAGWAWLTGEDEKAKLKRHLVAQFETTKKQKVSAFKKEWTGIVKETKKRYQNVIDDNVEQMNSQLNKLLESTRLEEVDIQKRLAIVQQREAVLLKIQKELNKLDQELSQHLKVKAEIR